MTPVIVFEIHYVFLPEGEVVVATLNCKGCGEIHVDTLSLSIRYRVDCKTIIPPPCCLVWRLDRVMNSLEQGRFLFPPAAETYLVILTRVSRNHILFITHLCIV